MTQGDWVETRVNWKASVLAKWTDIVIQECESMGSCREEAKQWEISRFVNIGKSFDSFKNHYGSQRQPLGRRHCPPSILQCSFGWKMIKLTWDGNNLICYLQWSHNDRRSPKRCVCHPEQRKRGSVTREGRKVIQRKMRRLNIWSANVCWAMQTLWDTEKTLNIGLSKFPPSTFNSYSLEFTLVIAGFLEQII